MNGNGNKNGIVTWKQLTFVTGILVVVLGYMINLGLDTRERVIRLEANLGNLIEQIDKGEISFKYNNK